MEAAAVEHDKDDERDEGEDEEEFEDEAGPQPFRYRLNVLLFVATVLSVLYTGAIYDKAIRAQTGFWDSVRALPQGLPFAGPLMAILLVHEFGHYFAARYHKVPASLPFFIPVPYLSAIGTMGAVISMKGRIKSRDALLDIGASGPLAGLVVAIPVLVYGLMHSPVKLQDAHGSMEGQSLLYLLMKRVVLGPIPDGHDVYLTSTAFAGWVGLFVTAINLLPVAQLDGGHVAYALFGRRQNRYARLFHWSLLAWAALNVVRFLVLAWGVNHTLKLTEAIGSSAFWIVWFGILHGMKRLAGENHPPTEPGELHPARRVIAVVTLALFVLLFMPTPFSVY